MNITVLSENTSVSETIGSEHGLSLYLEANGRRFLFDTGAGGLFAENAAKLGVDLASVEFAVLSHGHYDHGGGLRDFLRVNGHAKVYLHPRAFEKRWALRPGGRKGYIGLDETLLPNPRFVWTGDRFRIGEGLEVFAGVTGGRLRPAGNSALFMESGGALVPDDFAHEQNLIVEEDGKLLLLAGCAHSGIVNILERFSALRGRWPDFVVGGFHLYNPASGRVESPAVLAEISAFLLETGARFYTCHCTGREAYLRLKERMGDRIESISAGSRITL